jgi:hypothetical protein
LDAKTDVDAPCLDISLAAFGRKEIEIAEVHFLLTEKNALLT